MYSRTELLFGAAGIASLKNAHILVVGLGGVGGAATEMLARAGVGSLTIVDADVIQPSNTNRQLIALHTNINKPKVQMWKKRLMEINPHLNLTVYQEFLEDKNTISILTSQKFDFIVDAIDTISPKVFLIKQCIELNIPIISAMGAGGKLDPSKIKMDDISKTEYCALAKTIRSRLSKLGIKKGIMCVYSTEVVNKDVVIPAEGEKYKKSTTGTVSYMPNLFGCWLASYVIRTLANQQTS